MLVEPARGPQPSARREGPGHSEVRRRARVFRRLRVCFGYTRGFPRHQLPAILRLDVHRKVANTKAGVLTVDSRYGPIFSLRLFLLREGMTGEPSTKVAVGPCPRRHAGPTILRGLSGGYSNPKPAVGKESGGRPHSLAPKGELPIRTNVRIVQCNDQASLTSTVAAGARLRLTRVR